ncbi:MAG: hypothetical protein V4548_04690 [Bacteroidota bacterium]
MKDNYSYKYIGKINPIKREETILIILFFSVFLFGYLLTFGKIITIIIGITTVLSAIIYTLLKVDIDDNVILFTEEKLIYINKNKTTEFEYKDLVKTEFMHIQKNRSFVRLTLQNRKFEIDIDQKNNLNVSRIDFIDFLFSKNRELQVIENLGFEKYKYFILHNAVRKVLIKNK